MIEPLNPAHLTPAASLNRLRIAALLGLQVDPGVIGSAGYDLASTLYVAEQIRSHAAQLKLPSNVLERDDRELPPNLAPLLIATDTEVQASAQAIIRQLGRNIGYILLTLKRGDAENRAARTDWDESYWGHWAQVHSVYFAGGLMAESFWNDVRHGIQEVFTEAAMPMPHLELSIYGSSLPLVGAARRAAPDAERTLIFEFGGSFVKRAYAVYENGMLTELRQLLPLSVQYVAEGETSQLFDFIASTIAQTWSDALEQGTSLSKRIPVSVAAYVDPNGQPYERQGGAYAALRNLSPNISHSLSTRLTTQLNASIDVMLLHDGTAAATAYAGSANFAVILLGTAIGVGFPPPENQLRAIASSLKNETNV